MRLILISLTYQPIFQSHTVVGQVVDTDPQLHAYLVVAGDLPAPGHTGTRLARLLKSFRRAGGVFLHLQYELQRVGIHVVSFGAESLRRAADELGLYEVRIVDFRLTVKGSDHVQRDGIFSLKSNHEKNFRCLTLFDLYAVLPGRSAK